MYIYYITLPFTQTYLAAIRYNKPTKIIQYSFLSYTEEKTMTVIRSGAANTKLGTYIVN